MAENDNSNEIAFLFAEGAFIGTPGNSQADASSMRARLQNPNVTKDDLAAAIAWVQELADPDRLPDA